MGAVELDKASVVPLRLLCSLWSSMMGGKIRELDEVGVSFDKSLLLLLFLLVRLDNGETPLFRASSKALGIEVSCI